MTKTLLLRIAGRVQGVGYRAWAVREAHRLGIAGWVRNCSDGRVEALVSGPCEAVDRFILAAQEGPPGARVTELCDEPAADEAPVPFCQLTTI